MISEEKAEKSIEYLKSAIRGDIRLWGREMKSAVDTLHEAIDLIPLGWQVASDQLDSKANVAMEVDDENN